MLGDVLNDQIPPPLVETVPFPGNVDVVDFGLFISRRIQSTPLPAHWSEGTRCLSGPEFPDLPWDNVELPVIVWKVADRRPTPSEPKPTHKQSWPTQLNETADAVFLEYNWRFINLVDFYCVDSTNYLAYRLQEFLEDIVITHFGAFQRAGFQRVEYDSRVDDTILSVRDRVPDKYGLKATRYRVHTLVRRLVPETKLHNIDLYLTPGSGKRVNETVTRGAGDSDPLSHPRATFIIQVSDNVLSEPGEFYIKGTDYMLQNDEIEWLPGALRTPETGATYYVSYLYEEPHVAEIASSVIS